MKALKEWQEYEEAVRERDLGRALKFLESLEPLPSDVQITTGGGLVRDWEVLDACLNADDMKMVGSAYEFLQLRGFLPNFGKYKNRVSVGSRNVTPTILKSSTGLDASKLSPKKWGLSGSSGAVLVTFLGGVSFLLSKGIDIRPNLAAVLGLAWLDSIFLGGCCIAQISFLWPPYRRRVLVHEAGHLLIAYLMGCPIRGVILDPLVAVQMGIQGQAGTQFWDEKLEKELADGRLSSTAFDRYCMVLFAGIAAEALVYGEAEGGENDENLFRSICVLLQPPLSTSQMSNQARWAVQQSYKLLKMHKGAHRAAVKAIENGKGLGTIIRRVEEAMSQDQ
ncbi:hypothetical protein AMTR_s00062p00186450 [Amborella trichopoda]|uniref:Peptidase M41 domain-containing protein n=2 Tax=Amborella trichopoda TaxID=13333 RepID=U5D244_AMBTC|nr:hypothetical protein AMTR_s00062p00186450 [Amborella trichopoda]